MIHFGETVEEGPMLAFFFGFSCKKEVMVSEENREKLERNGVFFVVVCFLRGLKFAIDTKGNGRRTN